MNIDIIKNNLSKLREATGKSQVEVANELEGFQKQTISKYENGYSIPPIDRLIDLANYYNVTLDDLVNEKLYVDGNEIKLNCNTFDKYFSVGLLEKDFSNILIKREMFIKNINTNFAIIDQPQDDDCPYLQYISNNKYFEVENVFQIFDTDYERNLNNALIHTTKNLLPLNEQIGLIYGLGGTYDFLRKPSSLSIDISDEFLVLCKLASRGTVTKNGKISINIKYRDLILSNFRDVYDMKIKKVDNYNKIYKKISVIIEETYGVEYSNEDFEYPLEGYVLLLYLINFRNSLPETYDELIEKAKDITTDEFNELALPFRKELVNTLLNKNFPNIFEFRVDYEITGPNHIVNGLKHNIRKITEMNSSESLINYIVAEKYDKEVANEIFKNCVFDYFAKRNITWLQDLFEFKGINHILIYSSTNDEVYMRSHVEFIKSVWSTKKMRLINAGAFKILKSIVCKIYI